MVQSVFETIDDVPEFLSLIKKLPQKDWIYRGQANLDWNLLPKAGRPEYIDKDFINSINNADIKRFYEWKNLSIAYSVKRPTDMFACLALAQHYGLATRLLDWSLNPLVSLYYAVESFIETHGVVYIYSPKSVIKGGANISSHAEISLYYPAPFDKRLLAQSGVFTYHPNPSTPLEIEEQGIICLEITAENKPVIQSELNSIGINRKSLFPDIEGLSAFVNWCAANSMKCNQHIKAVSYQYSRAGFK